jgi:hypothetical protein
MTVTSRNLQVITSRAAREGARERVCFAQKPIRRDENGDWRSGPPLPYIDIIWKSGVGAFLPTSRPTVDPGSRAAICRESRGAGRGRRDSGNRKRVLGRGPPHLDIPG